MKLTKFLAIPLALCFAPTAHALIITPTFDASYNAQDKLAVNTAILYYESVLTNNVTVNINFANMTTGLAQSSQYLYGIDYSTLYGALNSQKTSSDDISAVNSLSSGFSDQATGASLIGITHADCSALGFNCGAISDGTISVNLGLTDANRADGISSGSYDLIGVVEHEIDEILGSGGGGSLLGYGAVGIEDLFRYTAQGVRTFTTSGDNAYFSIDGGKTDLARFNNDGVGDYGDWHTSSISRVQNAYGTPGVQNDIGVVELTALDVIGWNRVSATLPPADIPTPSVIVLLGSGLMALFTSTRRKRYVL